MRPATSNSLHRPIKSGVTLGLTPLKAGFHVCTHAAVRTATTVGRVRATIEYHLTATTVKLNRCAPDISTIRTELLRVPQRLTSTAIPFGCQKALLADALNAALIGCNTLHLSEGHTRWPTFEPHSET